MLQWPQTGAGQTLLLTSGISFPPLPFYFPSFWLRAETLGTLSVVVKVSVSWIWTFVFFLMPVHISPHTISRRPLLLPRPDAEPRRWRFTSHHGCFVPHHTLTRRHRSITCFGSSQLFVLLWLPLSRVNGSQMWENSDVFFFLAVPTTSQCIWSTIHLNHVSLHFHLQEFKIVQIICICYFVTLRWWCYLIPEVKSWKYFARCTFNLLNFRLSSDCHSAVKPKNPGEWSWILFTRQKVSKMWKCFYVAFWH